MALSLITLLAGAPSILGVSEAIRQGQQKDRREEHRARRCNLITSCLNTSELSRLLDRRVIVLESTKLFLDTFGTDREPFGHPFAGYYLPYPDEQYEGMVSTTTDVAPIMNWIYVDRNTYEVKYGVRADAQPNLTGPFDCTRQDRRLTFHSWEGFFAVEEEEGLWALYFDFDDDKLATKVAVEKRRLQIDLTRREKRWVKDPDKRKEDQALQNRPETTANPNQEEPVLSASQSREELEPRLQKSRENLNNPPPETNDTKENDQKAESLDDGEFLNINLDLKVKGGALSGDDPLTALQAQVKTQIDAQFRRGRNFGPQI